MITVKEIAKRCNVSPSTVSNILNGRLNAGEKTRQRVLECVKETGYQPNYFAQSIRKRSSRMISIIAEDLLTFGASPIVEAITAYCESADYRTVLMNMRLYSKWGNTWYGEAEKLVNAVRPLVQEALSIKVDGIIYVAGHCRYIDCLPETLPIPAVISYALSGGNRFPSIIIDDEKVKSAFSWFDKKMQILSLQSVAPGIIHKAEKDKKFFSFMNKILANTDLGIDQVVIDRKKPEDMFKEREDFLKIINGEDAPNIYGENRRILYWVDTEKTKKIVKRFLFEQTGIKGYHGQLDYNTQSDGTVAMLNLLPAVYDIMNDDCLFCIDEIENSIHPNLILALLNFFSRTKTKGQLIYTTHEALLLGNQSELRPDEIWLAEKREGNTKMYSLNDFKLHNTLNIENGYLAGRFGAIPRIENLDIDIENHADVK